MPNRRPPLTSSSSQTSPVSDSSGRPLPGSNATARLGGLDSDRRSKPRLQSIGPLFSVKLPPLLCARCEPRRGKAPPRQRCGGGGGGGGRSRRFPEPRERLRLSLQARLGLGARPNGLRHLPCHSSCTNGGGGGLRRNDSDRWRLSQRRDGERLLPPPSQPSHDLPPRWFEFQNFQEPLFSPHCESRMVSTIPSLNLGGYADKKNTSNQAKRPDPEETGVAT